MIKFARKIVGLLREANRVASKVGSDRWDRLKVALDYIYCRLQFHASESEYLDFQFYNFKNRYRKNFILRYHQFNKFKKLNKETTLTKYKYAFYQKLPDCFAREMIFAPACGVDAFVEFSKKHKKIVIKPDKGSLGRDVNIFTYQNDELARMLFDKIPEPSVCEEFICQHERMSALSPDSVNTIRIVSIWEPDGVKIISATLRTGGRAGATVDNLKKDGIGAQIDIDTGIVRTNGFDYNDHLYVKHPLTGVQFLGFNIPNWEAAVSLVKKAHGHFPQNQLLGWDIAITQTGADIVEANGRPGTPIMQMVDRIPKGEKILRAIRTAEKRPTRSSCSPQ